MFHGGGSMPELGCRANEKKTEERHINYMFAELKHTHT
jgi:hypothetical protein